MKTSKDSGERCSDSGTSQMGGSDLETEARWRHGGGRTQAGRFDICNAGAEGRDLNSDGHVISQFVLVTTLSSAKTLIAASVRNFYVICYIHSSNESVHREVCNTMIKRNVSLAPPLALPQVYFRSRRQPPQSRGHSLQSGAGASARYPTSPAASASW